MTDVFISYKQEERERMRPIANALREMRVEVWFDERLSPDKPFTEEIEEIVHSCKAQLVCWSPAAVRSEWVRGEAEIGRQRQTLVQIMIEPCALPPPFNMIHAENMSAWTGAVDHVGWQKILASLGRKLGRPGLADLAKVLGSGAAEDWRKWAAKYPADPLADEAWAKVEELHLSAERARLARERDASRRAGEEAEAKRRVAEEARRRPSPVSPPPQHAPIADPRPARPPWGLISGGVALGSAVIAFWLSGQLSPERAATRDNFPPSVEEPPPEVSEAERFARTLEGRWRIEGQTSCAYDLRLDGAQLLLLGPDGSVQRERLVGVEEGWLRTDGAGGVSSFFRQIGSALVFRYGSREDRSSQTEFTACED